MAEVILHHYELSPFGTAMRLALGHKGLSWKSVEAPLVSPKPDLSALTGGYERIPVLQIGADIYCDTGGITAALEQHTPEPSLYPEPMGVAGKMVAMWAGNSWFIPSVLTGASGSPDAFPDAFWEDRAVRFGLTKELFRSTAPHMQAQFAAGASVLASALSDGRAFIGGDAVGHADFCLYMNLNFAHLLAGKDPAEFSPQVGTWFDRVAAIGFGNSEEWSPEQAIQHAAESQPTGGGTVAETTGFTAGQRVIVGIDAPDPATVEGDLVALDETRITVARNDPRAGDVHVHFPRLGITLHPAQGDQ
jgi:glutathione S-transferase